MKNIYGKANKNEAKSLLETGNAFVANAAYKLAENVFTAQMNKPATKGNIKENPRRVKHYRRIMNLTLKKMFGHLIAIYNKNELAFSFKN